MSRKVKIIVIFLIIFIVISLAFIFYSYNRLSLDFGKKQIDSSFVNFQKELNRSIAEYDYDEFNTFKVKGIFITYDEKEDETFPDTSVRFNVGFVDNTDDMHIYPARIGGKSNDGRVIEPVLCRISEAEEVCKRVPAKGIRETLKNNDSIYLEIIERDNFTWLAAEQTNKHQSVITALKNAIIAGSGFPEAPEDEDFVLQVWVISKIL